jgi:hypothetical protein
MGTFRRRANCPASPRGGLTFVAVVVAWVPFGAASWAQTREVLAGLAGLNGVVTNAVQTEESLQEAWTWLLEF